MKLKEGVVYFKSVEPFFLKERAGRKNNTVRVLSENEYNIVLWTSVVAIDISNPATNEAFRRDITDISRIGTICGNHIVDFSWRV